MGRIISLVPQNALWIPALLGFMMAEMLGDERLQT